MPLPLRWESKANHLTMRLWEGMLSYSRCTQDFTHRLRNRAERKECSLHDEQWGKIINKKGSVNFPFCFRLQPASALLFFTIFIYNVDNGSLQLKCGCGHAGVHTCEHVPKYGGQTSALILILWSQWLGLPRQNLSLALSLPNMLCWLVKKHQELTCLHLPRAWTTSLHHLA